MRIIAAIPLLVAILPGCYSFSARTSTHIRSVAVPFFENRTDRFGLESQVTEAVARGFLEDGDLRVVAEHEADSVLRGVITRYENKAAVFDQLEQVTTMRVTITADITYRDLVSGAAVWEQKGLSAWGQYRLVPSTGLPAQTEEDGQIEAIGRLVQEILARSIETW
ncbi:MAG: LPS assembly lipoprotein LptE [Candidatus Eisenbacteria bacterium]|nr:LPS assembly lipoprotein LptE [Candidatus Eisenbacteria bacterium]